MGRRARTARRRRVARRADSINGLLRHERAPGTYARPLPADSALSRIVSALRLESRITILRPKDDPLVGGASLAARVDTAWNLAALASDYRRFLARFGGVIDTFRAAGAENG